MRTGFAKDKNMNIFENAEKYVNDCGIAEKILSAPAVVCAFSGGADSSVLLRFLSDYLKKAGKPLYAAHMNHMIRGEDADADENFCRTVCRSLGIELFVRKTDVPAQAKACGEGLEEAARRLRYAFLREISEKTGGALIATAHNSTDNAETVLFNLARGTSVHGLGGIAPVRDNIIRPLLFATSEEIREFAAENGISYVTDKTNSDTDYTRNLIRHTVIPNLRKINPRMDSAFLRLSGSARRDDGYLNSLAENIAGGRKIIPREAFDSLDDSLAGRVIMLLCSEKCTRKNISEKNISDVLELIKSKRVGSVSAPGVRIFVHRDGVFAGDDSESRAPDGEIPLVLGEFVRFGDYFAGIFENEENIPRENENIYNLFIHGTLDRDKIKNELFVRKRRAGDTFRLHSVNRKLKKLMCDEKIPQRLRASLPLVCDGDGIVFVPFLPAADGYSGKSLHIIIYQKKEDTNEQKSL